MPAVVESCDKRHSAMPLYIACAFILLPRSILGLILMASQDSVIESRNIIFISDDDLLAQSPVEVPSTNLERMTFPLEEGDITLFGDIVIQHKKPSKQRQRLHRFQRSPVFHWNENIHTDKPYFKVAQSDTGLWKSSQMRRKQFQHMVEPFLIRNGSNREHDSQESEQRIISRHTNIHTFRHSSLDDQSSLSSQLPTITSWLHPLRVPEISSKTRKLSLPSSTGKLYPLFVRGSTEQNIPVQQKELSMEVRNHTLPDSNRTSGYRTSDLPRHKRQAPAVARVELPQQVGMNSGIGQPIILRKRSRTDAKVGVLVVVENSIYRQYLQDNGNNPKAALARIRRYYGMIFAMMDQRFKTINDPYLSISVSISGIVVAERREDSSWLELIVDWSTVSSHGRGSVLTDRALKKFSKWIGGRTDLPEFDHAMVFTAYRLTNKQGVSLGGMAYLNAICDTKSGNAVSIVADAGDFQCVKVATHELAHSLGAHHDGDRQSKTCRADSNYVMSPLTSHENQVLRNAFYFSPCSIRDMSYQLSKTSSSCVNDDPRVYYSYDLERLPPGQLYSADMQCKLIFGKKSEYCREGNLVDIMCGQLWCRDPNKDNSCRTNTYLTALPGTECAPNRVCHLGECIIDVSKNAIQMPPVSTSINVISRVVKPNQPSFRMQGPQKQDPNRLKKLFRLGKRGRRKKRNQCTEDKNSKYCEGLIKLNPGGCERRAIRQYCCATCRHQQRQRPRRI